MSLALQMDQGPWRTAEEFMDWPGDGTGRRYQLIDGELVAMAPPSTTHARLQARMATRLNNHLAKHHPQCESLINPGVQPRADAARNVRSPDLVVSCGSDEGKLVDEPVLIVEILSPSNACETREAVRACLSSPSLRQVLILSSEASPRC
jgi:Uma2 family endonuclease